MMTITSDGLTLVINPGCLSSVSQTYLFLIAVLPGYYLPFGQCLCDFIWFQHLYFIKQE